MVRAGFEPGTSGFQVRRHWATPPPDDDHGNDDNDGNDDDLNDDKNNADNNVHLDFGKLPSLSDGI